MILMDDLQQHVIKSERQFAKELVHQVVKYYMQLNSHEGEGFFFEELFKEWKNHQELVLEKLLSWYSCDNGITPKGKEEIFLGVLEQYAKMGSFKPHMKNFRNLNRDDLELSEHEVLKTFLDRFAQAEAQLKKDPLNNKEIFKKLEAQLKEHGAQVKKSKYLPQRQLQKDGINSRTFFEYIEKKLDEVLGQCMEYEQTVSKIFEINSVAVEPFHPERLGSATSLKQKGRAP